MPLLTVKASAAQPTAGDVESLLLEISGRIARHLGKPEAPLRQERCPPGLTHPPGGQTDDHETDL